MVISSGRPKISAERPGQGHQKRTLKQRAAPFGPRADHAARLHHGCRWRVTLRLGLPAAPRLRLQGIAPARWPLPRARARACGAAASAVIPYEGDGLGGVMALLELRSIAKHFGAIEALKGVDLDLEPGEVLGLMGDNGAGKSTLVKIIAGNFPPSEGEIRLRAGPATSTPVDARRRHRGGLSGSALCDNLTAAPTCFSAARCARKWGCSGSRLPEHVRARRLAVRRAQVGDPAARSGQADVRAKPGRGDRPHAAVRGQDRADGRADRRDQRAPGGRGAGSGSDACATRRSP